MPTCAARLTSCPSLREERTRLANAGAEREDDPTQTSPPQNSLKCPAFSALAFQHASCLRMNLAKSAPRSGVPSHGPSDGGGLGNCSDWTLSSPIIQLSLWMYYDGSSHSETSKGGSIDLLRRRGTNMVRECKIPKPYLSFGRSTSGACNPMDDGFLIVPRRRGCGRRQNLQDEDAPQCCCRVALKPKLSH